MVLTFRYRLLPSKAQHRALEQILEAQRQLYNAALEERMGAYRKAGKSLTYFDQTKSLTEWRKDDAEASQLPVNVQRATLKRLDEAYRGFFRRVQAGDKPGFPRFRGKGRFDSFGFREFDGITFRNGRLRFKGMPGSLRIHWHRELPGASIKSCTFKRGPKGWSVGFAIEVVPADPGKTSKAVGVDLGLSTFAALSDGGFIPSLRAARKAERRLRIALRALERRSPGSGGRRKARVVLARCHADIARQRREHLHQASARLIRDYDAIAVEKLNVKGLARSALAKDLIKVDPSGTTQGCSGCGTRVLKELAERWHDCPDCGLSMDRDLNAARNILNRAGVGPGLRNVAGSYGMRAGESLRSSPRACQEHAEAN